MNYCAAFSTLDLAYLATGCDDGTVRHFDIRTGKVIKLFHPHTSTVRSVAYNLDGDMIVAGSYDDTVSLIDLDADDDGTLDAEPQIRKLSHGSSVHAVCFTVDGERVISGGSDRRAVVWQVSSGEQVCVFTGHEDWVRAVSQVGDNMAASAGDDRVVYIWKLDTAEKLHCLEGHTQYIFALLWEGPGSNILFSAGDDQTIRKWHVTEAAASEVWPEAVTQDAGVCGLSRGNDLLMSISRSGIMRTYARSDGAAREPRMSGLSEMFACIVNEESNEIMFACQDETGKIVFLYRIDSRTGETSGPPMQLQDTSDEARAEWEKSVAKFYEDRAKLMEEALEKLKFRAFWEC